MKQKLTQRQQEVLDYIKSCELPPTYAEIAKHFGFKNVTGAFDHCKALKRKGWIEIMPSISRGIKVIGSVLDLLKPVSHIDEIPVDGREILVWDGFYYEIDCVEHDSETGCNYMANGSEPIAWAPLDQPEEQG